MFIHIVIIIKSRKKKESFLRNFDRIYHCSQETVTPEGAEETELDKQVLEQGQALLNQWNSLKEVLLRAMQIF